MQSLILSRPRHLVNVFSFVLRGTFTMQVAGIAIGAQVASVVVSKVITTGSLGVVTVVGALTSLVGLGALRLGHMTNLTNRV